MDITSTVQSLKPQQLKDMVADFERLVRVGQRCGTPVRTPSGVVKVSQQYGIVARTLHLANIAGRKGDEGRAAFMNGMAAAFYGLLRLSDAAELERQLAPRLDPRGSAGDSEQPTGESSKKEDTMLEVQQRFRFEDLISFLEADNLRYMTRPEDAAAMASFSGNEGGPIQLLARVDDEAKVMVLRFNLPITIPEHKREEVSQELTRINYRLLLGSFAMDFDDGEFGYRVVVPIDEAQLSLAQYRHCMGASFRMIRRHLPRFYKLVFGGEVDDTDDI